MSDVTILNSQLSPTVVYNLAGTTIDSIVGNGLDNTAPTAIQRSGQRTIIVYAGTDNSNRAIELPAGADVGDEVIVLRDRDPSAPSGPIVFAPSGETFYHNYSPSGGALSAHYVKIASTEWGIIA